MQITTRVDRRLFGRLPSGEPVDRILLVNALGMEAEILTYGGILRVLRVPDRDGALADIVLGYDDLDTYLDYSPYFGALIGRYANRIGRGRFTLDGTTYELAVNSGSHHLHGGRRGFDQAVWYAAPFARANGPGVVLSYTSPDGEEGYPGTVRAQVTYTLSDQGALLIDYHATTDEATPLNLTHHSYFNLTGDPTRDVLKHELTIHADAYTPIDATLLPTGEIAPVDGTPFDFRTPTPIGAHIDEAHEQVRHASGYDHNFVLQQDVAGALVRAAHVYEPTSGRSMEVFTTEPGLQCYTGNGLHEARAGKGGIRYADRTGFCLETQHFPDAPNRPHFPPTILKPGRVYRSRTIYAFSAE